MGMGVYAIIVSPIIDHYGREGGGSAYALQGGFGLHALHARGGLRSVQGEVACTARGLIAFNARGGCMHCKEGGGCMQYKGRVQYCGYFPYIA